MPSSERWLDAVWPTVRDALPPAPAAVVEIGCGSLGGFVPRLREAGYEALGVDPAAPEGPGYQRSTFERSELPGPLDAVVACASLHHVDDPAAVVDKLAASLRPGGVAIVVEWDWWSFDEASARWCFARLGGPGEDHSWLSHAHERWTASGQPWADFFHGWAEQEGLHRWERLSAELDRRLQRLACRRAPYLFAQLPDTSEAEERAAIAAGEVPANRVDYVGTVPVG